jgi:hypothetical protein
VIGFAPGMNCARAMTAATSIASSLLNTQQAYSA